jgi:hypothetical protein
MFKKKKQIKNLHLKKIHLNSILFLIFKKPITIKNLPSKISHQTIMTAIL